MSNDKLGLITYNAPHLKTEQVIQKLLGSNYNFKIYALPFIERTPRETWFAHRPDQSVAVAPQAIAKKHNITYSICTKDTDIDNSCDAYLIFAAGVLSAECVSGKKIINCHPGIIPSSRGLDAFKWALYEMKPLGVSLHYIDAEVDAGEIISIIPTHVYTEDSVTTLARRHYENEIDCLANFSNYLKTPQNRFFDIERDESKRRMPIKKSKSLYSNFLSTLRSMENEPTLLSILQKLTTQTARPDVPSRVYSCRTFSTFNLTLKRLLHLELETAVTSNESHMRN